MYGGREALPDDHKLRGQRGRARARYRRPQLGRGTEKTGETSQRKTKLQLASGAFSCKVAPFTPAGERTKKAPSRGGRTGSNGQQHPVVIARWSGAIIRLSPRSRAISAPVSSIIPDAGARARFAHLMSSAAGSPYRSVKSRSGTRSDSRFSCAARTPAMYPETESARPARISRWTLAS